MKKVQKIIFSKIIGIMFFLIILYVLNAINLDIYVYRLWVNFLNENAALLVIMSLFFMVAEVFFALMFPFSLPGPLFSSSAAVLLTKFIFRIFLLIDNLINVNVFASLWPLSLVVYPLVFIFVFIGGYISIFSKMGKNKDKKKKEDKEWEEIGKEFKKAFADFFRKLADSIDKR